MHWRDTIVGHATYATGDRMHECIAACRSAGEHRGMEHGRPQAAPPRGMLSGAALMLDPGAPRSAANQDQSVCQIYQRSGRQHGAAGKRMVRGDKVRVEILSKEILCKFGAGRIFIKCVAMTHRGTT